jgi:hypothetical protein
VTLAMVRARQQPSLDVGVDGTTAAIAVVDVALAALLVAAAVHLRRVLLAPRLLIGAAAGFAAWILISAAANGAAAFVSAGKLVLLGALAIGAAALVTDAERLHHLVILLLGVTIVADAYGLANYVAHAGGRQQAFLGEHDFAALATVPLAYGLVTFFEPDRRTPRLRWIAIAAGGLGLSLAAAVAGLVGTYIALLVVLSIARVRGRLALRPALAAVAVVIAVSIPTFWLRNNDLGFLHAWFGPAPANPAEYASSWSQRLIFAYIGGRVFLDHPIAGTGWSGTLPSAEYARFLPDARSRFADQPANYFPPAGGSFTPQQTYDQVLYELGLIGAALFLAILVGVVRANVQTVRDWRDRRADGWAPYLPAVLTASVVGALAGEGLFGGTPTAALFWLSIGVAAALVRPEGAE